MTQKEESNIREFINNKSILLMKSESRSFAKSGFDISHYSEIEYAGRKFVIISTNVFYQILNSVLIEACEKYPEYFGKDDVNKVLQALYQIENMGTIDQFYNFLKTEQFAWILELVDERVNSQVLRIELFRQVDKLKNDESKNEFTGGVFHSFKHFTYKGIPLSTKKENKEINHPKSIIEFLIQGFFCAELIMKSEKKYESKINLPDGRELFFSFYKEKIADIYFVNSVIYK
ncbi:hypothetical protein [Flavobacterium ammonificans]|uniref:hypothetical protein n=1 Tax=Flavobacterium ammonificans TaxID=1751056 RepID=UPI001E319993|nr:hypothetical protein [Flavobacterium ammonificans]BDB55849.1 hypothetical protein SHINM13_01450 [Flavobacterium ammonificans]